jgi:DHA1 family bicyclomycin/chloramphenicol resistance-like MFS transporter
MNVLSVGMRWPAVVGSRRWIATLSAMTAVTALSIDMSLPAQPALARAFDVPESTAQLTLSLFLAGFAVAQIVTGYLSDVLGRRRVMIGGLVLFTLAGVACAMSPSIEVLLACRVLQGIGAAAAPVVARAMVRDTQPGAEAARLLSSMLAALAIAPMVAPVIGGALLDAFGWRAIFVMLTICGVLLLAIASTTLEETLPAGARSTHSLLRGFATFLRTPGTKLPMLISCASFAGQFAYISDSPFVLIEGYHVAPSHYGFYFGATALALMLGSLGGGAMLRAGRSPRAMLVLGTSLLLAGGVLVVIGTRAGLGVAGFLVPMLVYFLGIGLTSPSATALAMEPVPQLAGTASAAIGSLQMIAGAISGYETTRLGGSSPRLFSIVVAVMGPLALVLAVAAVRRARNR